MERVISIIAGIGICFVIFLFLACGAIALAVIYVTVGIAFLFFVFTKEGGMKKLPLVFFFSALAIILLVLAPAACQSFINPNPSASTTLRAGQEDCQCGTIIFREEAFFLKFSGDEIEEASLIAPKSWFVEKNKKLLDGARVTYEFTYCTSNGEICECILLHSKNPKVDKLIHPRLR